MKSTDPSTGDCSLRPLAEGQRVADNSRANEDEAPLGILLLDQSYQPVPPGTAGYVSSPDGPVRCHVVEGCTVARLIFENDGALEESMVAAARQLVDEGARAITGNCGFMMRHQAAVSNAVDVPVLLSSLLLAPLILACMGSRSKLGIVTASGASLTEDLLRLAGVSDPGRVVMGDLADQPAFRTALLDLTGEYDRPAIKRATVKVTSALVGKHPEVAAILLECTELPRDAAALQRAVGVPVFDVVRLTDLFAAGLAPPAVHPVQLDGAAVSSLAAGSLWVHRY